MWWAHTPTDRPAMVRVANTSALYPKMGRRENTGRIWVTTPKNGRTMMYTSGCPKNQNRCCQRIGHAAAG